MTNPASATAACRAVAATTRPTAAATPAKSMRVATEGPSSFWDSSRPVAIAAANRPGPRPPIAGPVSSVRSRNSALHPSSPLSTRNATASMAPTTSNGRAMRTRCCARSAGASGARLNSVVTSTSVATPAKIHDGWAPARRSRPAPMPPQRTPIENAACSPSMTRTPWRASIVAACVLIATSSMPVPIPTNASAPYRAGTECARPGSTAAIPNVAIATGTSRAPNRSASRPAASIDGSDAIATQSSPTPSWASLAPVCRCIAGSDAAHAPQYNPKTANAPARGRACFRAYGSLELQGAVDQVVLLQPAQPLANVTRANRPDAADRLEVALRRADDRLEVAEIRHDLPDDGLRQSGDVREDAVAARRDGVVERIDVARIAEELGDALDFEQLAVGQGVQPLQRKHGARPRAVGVVVVQDGGALRRHLADELVQLHANEPGLGAELDAVAVDLRCHSRRHLGALQDDEHVVENDGFLELQRRQARKPLVEPLPIRLERRQRLVRLRQHFWHGIELVAGLPDVHRDRRPLLRDRHDERAGLLRDTFGRAVPGAGLVRRDRRIRHQLDVRVRDLRQRRVDDDRAVHLRELVEELRRERLVEPHAARVQKRQLGGVADDDQSALVRANHVVDRLPQLGARRDPLERGEQARVPAWIVLRRCACEAEGGGL